MKFSLAGLGYVSPKHLEAIKSVGGEVTAVCNMHDSVGILDKYFPKAELFLNKEEFAKYLKDNKPDYLSICTPNNTHLDYLILADGLGIKSICEKPVVIYPNQLELFSDTNVILQLRYASNLDKIIPFQDKVYITYNTPRGKWYHKSWKADKDRSGGLLINIGIHLFDLMIYKFGQPSHPKLYKISDSYAEGSFFAGAVEIKWTISIYDFIKPERVINGVNLEFKDGHIKAYREILAGRGIKKEETRKALELINEYRSISKNS